MKRYVYPLLGGFLLAQAVLYAETIRGSITHMDPMNNVLSIKRTDAAKNTPQELHVQVTEATKAKNVASLKELQIGHEVKIDAKENKASGVYEAKSVEVVSPEGPTTQVR